MSSSFINYKGVQIPKSEAEFLEKIEKMIPKELVVVKNIEYDTVGFVIKEGHVSGLGLYNCELKGIPDSIENLNFLETLWIYENKLTTIPKSIGSLSNLKDLYIHYNKLEKLSKEMFKSLTNLRRCHMGGNQLKELPDALETLENLEEFYLTGSAHDMALTNLPPSFSKLSSLKTLWISNNRFTKLPEVISNLKQLEDLYANDNTWMHYRRDRTPPPPGIKMGGIEEFPDWLCFIPKLKRLQLGNNNIKKIPECIGNLSLLEELNVSNNLISVIPDTIGGLVKL
ncbi:MAG: leucine-rich repeat domain-containing protein [Candidatus Helarchaeota archaeon]